MSKALPRLAVTVGEPAGIGPDIVLQLAEQVVIGDLVAFADPNVLIQRATQLGSPVTLDVKAQHEPSLHLPGKLKVIPVMVKQPVQIGKLNTANAPYVIETLRQACQGCMNGDFDALVTAPVHKGVINEAGIKFSGHTEFFAEQTKTKNVVMMLTSPGLRVALATTHLPLTQVSSAITPQSLETTIRILHHDLQEKLDIFDPQILVCGLNPHAGEDGHLGREDIDIIQPVLEKLRHEGMNLVGPAPADTAFTPSSLLNAHVVLCMYHDQGLPVLKHRCFGGAVNITLGLPIIRTSVDHGTALELAGTGQALSDSLHCAVDAALEMVSKRRIMQTS